MQALPCIRILPHLPLASNKKRKDLWIVKGQYDKIRHIGLVEEIIDASVNGDHVVDTAACKHGGKYYKQQQYDVHDLFSLKIFSENSEK